MNNSAEPADPAGPVDQHVEGFVERRHRARRGLVAALEADHVGHLLIHRDAGGRLPPVAGRRDERLRRRLLLVGRADVAADANRGGERKRLRLLHDDVLRRELDVIEHVAAHE